MPASLDDANGIFGNRQGSNKVIAFTREDMMEQPGLDGRHRTLLGRISRKHGNTLVGTLRAHHGANFLLQFQATDDLADVLKATDEPSLSQLEKHYPHDGHG